MTAPQVKAGLLASPDDTEAQFYEALAAGDLARLMAVWSDDDDVVCVHPGGSRVVGHAALRASFEAIFANGPIPVQPESVRRLQSEGTAVHSVLERLDVATDQGLQTAHVIATNVYVKTAQGWRLVAHHASAAAAFDLPETHEIPGTLH
jgi:uncharacterized protein (TIGR02246 family)